MAARLVFSLLIGAVCVLPHAALAQAADPLEGLTVREIRVTGLRYVPSASVERHLVTRAGQPFRRAALDADRRRLDELRLFTSTMIDPWLENGGVVLHVAVTETLRLLPVVIIRVTDQNGLSGGPGLRGINLLGRESQTGVAAHFGGETGVTATVDATTLTPGTWTKHLGFSYTKRENTLYGFDESATAADGRFARNWNRGLRTGATADLLVIGANGSAEPAPTDDSDVVPTLGAFVMLDRLDSSTNPRHGTWAEVEVNKRFRDADSWTFILDGRRFQRLSDRHGIGLFSLATFQTGQVGDGLPDYLQFDLGGANSIRGWTLGSRRGRHQWINTLEYTYVAMPVRPFSVANVNLYAGVQAVGFADAGRAWGDSDGDASAIDGYGLGLRFLVPFVDVIRLDVAWGEPERGATAYFGVSLKAARQRQRVR